jgi:uncharacterized protein YegL
MNMKTNGLLKMAKNAYKFLGLDEGSEISGTASGLPNGYIGTNMDISLMQGSSCIILVIDVSGSMGYQDCSPSRLAAAIMAAAAFIRERAAIAPQDLIGIVSFNTRGRIELPLMPITSVDSAVKALQKLRIRGGTDLDAGLKTAWVMLEPQLCEGISGWIIFLTDGQGGNPITRAKAIKSCGVLVEAIGFAGCESEVDTKLLRKVATTDANGFTHYWFFKDTQSLVTHYKELATGVMYRGHNR